MSIEQTVETGHDITLATHLVKNFDSYSEELKARVRDFKFGKSVERRVEHYSRRSPSNQLVLNIDRTGQVTSSGLASPRADLILTVWPGSKTLSGTVISNDDEPKVIRRVVIRRPNQTRAEFARELLKELGKEIREHADRQLNEAFGAEVTP